MSSDRSRQVANFCPITVELSAAPNMRFRSEVPCSLGMEAVRYAVCRFISHTPRLMRYYAAQSCKLRYETSRKARKPKRFRCLARASLLELPAAWALLQIQVDPDGITVTGLELTKQRPLRKPPAEKDPLPKIGVWRAGEDD